MFVFRFAVMGCDAAVKAVTMVMPRQAMDALPIASLKWGLTVQIKLAAIAVSRFVVMAVAWVLKAATMGILYLVMVAAFLVSSRMDSNACAPIFLVVTCVRLVGTGNDLDLKVAMMAIL